VSRGSESRYTAERGDAEEAIIEPPGIAGSTNARLRGTAEGCLVRARKAVGVKKYFDRHFLPVQDHLSDTLTEARKSACLVRMPVARAGKGLKDVTTYNLLDLDNLYTKWLNHATGVTACK